MEELKQAAQTAENTPADNTAENAEKKLSPESVEKLVIEKMEETRQKAKAANEAMSEGKGRLTLETPIKSGDKDITELKYDFTALTGLEYTDALDSDANMNPNAIQSITHKQALALFAKAAAKQTSGLDMQDIMTRIGATDAVKGVQLSKLFFVASTRAGFLRISKM